MKLLVVTQAVDAKDPALGFFVSWIEKFARECDRVEVICLREGMHALPETVRVHSLGKEHGPKSRLTYARRFLGLAWRVRGDYDAVFVHMNPEYLVIAGWLWRLLCKPTGLWYVHKSVTMKLRIATFFTDKIFTASKESFRLPSPKLMVMGHGIDMASVPRVESQNGVLRLVAFGRISASKGLHEALAVLDVLDRRGIPFEFTIVGSAVTAADRPYEASLRADVASRSYASRVHFLGPVHYPDLPKVLAQADVFLHLSDTGGLDKTGLEALIAGVPVVTSNEPNKPTVPAEWRVHRDDPEGIADAVVRARGSDMREISARIRAEHDLTKLIPRIVSALRPTRASMPNRILMRTLLFVRDLISPLSRMPEVAVLCYHSISDAQVDTAVDPRTFERHLGLLRASGAAFVSLDRVIAWHRGVGTMPRRAVALTFDDGYLDFKTHALPILEKLGAPSTLFVVGDPAAARNRIGNDLPLLSQDDIASFTARDQVTVGYHSRTHANPLDAGTDPSSECERPSAVTIFAYPGGNYTPAYVEAIKRAGYIAACSIKPDLVTPASDGYLLPRSVVTGTTPDWMVRYYTTRAVAWYRRARRSLRH